MARSTSVAKSLPFFCTAESARWPSMNGLAAASRTSAASETNASRSVSFSAIDVLLRHRGQRLRQRESSGVQRLPDDGTFDAAVDQRADGAQVIQAGDPAGGDHRRVGALGDLGEQLEVGTVQRAVLGDVCDDEARTSFAVKTFQHLP